VISALSRTLSMMRKLRQPLQPPSLLQASL